MDIWEKGTFSKRKWKCFSDEARNLQNPCKKDLSRKGKEKGEKKGRVPRSGTVLVH